MLPAVQQSKSIQFIVGIATADGYYDFFAAKSREDLENILKDKSGIDGYKEVLMHEGITVTDVENEAGHKQYEIPKTEILEALSMSYGDTLCYAIRRRDSQALYYKELTVEAPSTDWTSVMLTFGLILSVVAVYMAFRKTLHTISVENQNTANTYNLRSGEKLTIRCGGSGDSHRKNKTHTINVASCPSEFHNKIIAQLITVPVFLPTVCQIQVMVKKAADEIELTEPDVILADDVNTIKAIYNGANKDIVVWYKASNKNSIRLISFLISLVAAFIFVIIGIAI
jgi:hypothetical protein